MVSRSNLVAEMLLSLVISFNWHTVRWLLLTHRRRHFVHHWLWVVRVRSGHHLSIGLSLTVFLAWDRLVIHFSTKRARALAIMRRSLPWRHATYGLLS